MCGRFGWRFDGVLRAWFREAVPEVDGDAAALAEEDRYNIAPTDPVVAVVPGSGGPRARVARWGFRGPSGPVVNARAETADRSPLWAPHWGRHHAVVPASGFYEWTGRGAGRTPYWVHRTDDAPLLFAALVDGPGHAPEGVAGAPHPLRNEQGSAALPPCSVSILTCAPNAYMERLHDRMPVVLEPEAVDAWLAAAPGWRDLVRTAPEVLTGHAVGREVGDVRAEGPRLVEPVRAWF